MEIIGIDFGDVRIGVARANKIAKLPEPLITVTVDGSEIEALTKIINNYNTETIVVGMPRGLEGQKTEQSQKTEAFVVRLRKSTPVDIVFQDESLTSVVANELIDKYTKKGSTVDKDQMAAVVILEDYLARL